MLEVCDVRIDPCLAKTILVSGIVKVTEHLWVLILPNIFLLVSMKALD
jgi:hypothetical protein